MPARKGDSLEADELWTFVRSKDNPRWVWLVVSFLSRQIVSVAVGDRGLGTAERLWAGVPRQYRRKRVYTDGYVVYPELLGAWQHRPSPKGGGRTNTVERINLTLRQRLAFLVRRTLAFAKREDRLLQRLLLFVHRYNRECARRYAGTALRGGR